jgi:DoxX-like family
MQAATKIAPVSQRSVWAGRIISALPALLMLFGGILKLAKPASVLRGFAQYGFPERLVVPVGTIELVSAVLYVIPQTAILGAILMTGVLGGAVATNLRAGNPVLVVPAVLGVLFWLGLYLRDDRLRDVFQNEAQPPASKGLVWTGRIISGLTILFMLFDAVAHLIKPAPVVTAFAQLGFPLQFAISLGIIELVCVAAYAIPRSSLVGAILLTGYLGGAVVTQLRVDNPLFGEALFPVYVGVLVWAGLYLRDQRFHAFIPLRRN